VSDVVRDAIDAEIASLVRLVRVPTASGFGVDLACIDDLDPRLSEVDPATTAGLAQDCYHRITTPRGSVPDSPDYGIDLRSYLSKPTTQRNLLAMAADIVSEIRKDDRVADALADVTATDPKTLAVVVRVTPADPDLLPFTLILAVTDGATLLQAIS
jgi:hypothetical protein